MIRLKYFHRLMPLTMTYAMLVDRTLRNLNLTTIKPHHQMLDNCRPTSTWSRILDKYLRLPNIVLLKELEHPQMLEFIRSHLLHSLVRQKVRVILLVNFLIKFQRLLRLQNSQILVRIDILVMRQTQKVGHN